MVSAKVDSSAQQINKNGPNIRYKVIAYGWDFLLNAWGMLWEMFASSINERLIFLGGSFA